MKQISQDTVNKNVNYITEGIKKVITTFGTRAPGSQGEAKAQEFFAKELGKYADTVKTQEFTLRPQAFMGWIYFEIFFILAAVTCLWFNINLAAILITVTAVVLLVYQLLLYVHVTAPFFPKKTSSNVFATKKPEGEIKRRIILCGHTDAAPEWGYLKIGGAILFEVQLFAAVSTIFFILGVAIAGIVKNGLDVKAIVEPSAFRTALIVCTAYCVPVIISMVNFSRPWKTVDGANDNLTACYTALSVLKTLKEENIKLQNTEVCALMAGSEEAGLRGAMAFAKANKEALSDVETIVVVMETLREPEHLSLYVRDMNAIVKTDLQVARLVQEAGEQAIGRKIKFSAVPMGATDSAAFALEGYKSTCLAALNHQLQPYYHTRKDTYDNLSPECLELSFKTVMKTVELYDQKGLS